MQGGEDLDRELQRALRRRRKAAKQYREADSDLAQIRELRRVRDMTPEQRRKLWVVIRGGLIAAAIALVAGATWFAGQIREHPVRPIAIAGVVLVAAIIALLPRPRGEDDLTFPPTPPHAIRTPSLAPTLPTLPTITPTPSPEPADEGEGMPDVEADAEGAIGGLGEMPGAEDDPPEATPTDGPSAPPTPTRTGSPIPTLPTPPTPPPTPSPTPRPSPTPPRDCTIEVEVKDVVELCVNPPGLVGMAVVGMLAQLEDVIVEYGPRQRDGPSRGGLVVGLPPPQGRVGATPAAPRLRPTPTRPRADSPDPARGRGVLHAATDAGGP